MRLVTRPDHEGFCSITIGSEHVLGGLAAVTEIIAAQLASCGDGRRLRADTTGHRARCSEPGWPAGRNSRPPSTKSSRCAQPGRRTRHLFVVP
jgi:hypothetical protein